MSLHTGQVLKTYAHGGIQKPLAYPHFDGNNAYLK